MKWSDRPSTRPAAATPIPEGALHRVNFNMPKILYRRVRVAAAEQGITVRELLTTMIQEQFG